MEYEISIKLLHDEAGFIYSVRRGGELIDAAVVHPTGRPVFAPLDEYYGGSMAVD
jgi:hypothetical protein